MLEDFITPVRIANSILQKSMFKGTYLIVEGHNDFSVYRKFANEEFCNIEIAFGNGNVINVIDELKKRGFHDAIGIIDSDFRILENDIPPNPNIFLTDDHDLELMIFKSDAFETVLLHYADPEKLKALRAQNNNDEIRDIFLNLAKPLGYLKWANKQGNLCFVFKPLAPEGNPLNISDFIAPNSLIFSGYEKMISSVINYSRNKIETKTTKEQAIKWTKNIIDNMHDLYQLCNGHDVINIVCISLRRKLSNLNSNALKPEQLEKELIFAYDTRYFEQTALYQQIKKWELSNGKPVLKF
jgi:hypothetical protein